VSRFAAVASVLTHREGAFARVVFSLLKLPNFTWLEFTQILPTLDPPMGIEGPDSGAKRKLASGQNTLHADGACRHCKQTRHGQDSLLPHAAAARRVETLLEYTFQASPRAGFGPFWLGCLVSRCFWLGCLVSRWVSCLAILARDFAGIHVPGQPASWIQALLAWVSCLAIVSRGTLNFPWQSLFRFPGYNRAGLDIPGVFPVSAYGSCESFSRSVGGLGQIRRRTIGEMVANQDGPRLERLSRSPF
jgi:hypothetical protein